MNLLKSLMTVAILATVAMAQLPKPGTMLLSLDGSIGIPLGGMVTMENDYGEKRGLIVTNTAGDTLEKLTYNYRHFNWSGEMSFDVFMNKRVALGLNGGYYGISQRVVAEENNLKENTGILNAVGAGHLGLTFIIPVEDNMFVSMKVFGGYALGNMTRVPTIVQGDYKAGSENMKIYDDSLNSPVEVKGPSLGFETKINIFRTYGLMGSIGIRYGVQILSTDEDLLMMVGRDNYTDDSDSWVNHTISATASVGFGFKMAQRMNYYN